MDSLGRMGRRVRWRRTVLGASAFMLLGLRPVPAGAEADEAPPPDEAPVEVIRVVSRQPTTATSTLTIPADHFELRPLESGGQMLEAVPNLLTAQHTGGGKAEQYFLRGFDADHGTDLLVYFDGVPVNLRSHAHGQGYIDLHFVTPETIDRLDAFKGPYFTRFGDFATAATVKYVPGLDFPESFVKFEAGQYDTLRAVGLVSPRTGPFAPSGPARGFASFEMYHTDGPFKNDEDLWRYSGLLRGEVDVTPDLKLSGHLLGYYADWDASGLLPKRLVRNSPLDRFDSLDPTEGGDTTRGQGKLQLDWYPSPEGHFMANAYVSYYDFELFSNFTYFLDDPENGDGIVQRDKDRIYTGGRVEYVHRPRWGMPLQLRAGAESRYDDTRVFLGTQTRRRVTGTTSDDAIEQLSVEPYADFEVEPLPWVRVQGGVRFAWFRFDGRDKLAGQGRGSEVDSRWLPKANLRLTPFSDEGPLPVEWDGLRNLELFVNAGIGYHSNDARSVFEEDGQSPIPKATGFELGLQTRLLGRVDMALAGFYLNLDDELVFVGDEGTTESAGESNRLGVEFALTAWLLDWYYVRGDVAYTSAKLDDGNTPIQQAPRFVAKAATGVRIGGFSAELNLRHLGQRYATEEGPSPKLSDYTVLDFGARYRWRFLEVGGTIENITNVGWSSSEFFYESRPLPNSPASEEDRHFSPGNDRNVRAWVTAYF